MEPSPRETRVALTEPHMGQCRLYYSTYNWGDEEESSCSPWFPCHCSVTVVKESGKIKSPQCVCQMETVLSKKSWPLSLEMDTLIVRSTYLAYWWQTCTIWNWSFPFHTKLCCLSFRCENNIWPGLSIWSGLYKPLTESRASKL